MYMRYLKLDTRESMVCFILFIYQNVKHNRIKANFTYKKRFRFPILHKSTGIFGTLIRSYYDYSFYKSNISWKNILFIPTTMRTNFII